MILFFEDWAKYPTAIPDTTTKNTSWLRLAYMYRTIFNLKNWQWLLALHNPALRGVDPYDPFLTEELKIAIIDECAVNPWYFLREVARVPAKVGFDHPRLRVDRGTTATWWLFFNHIDTGNVQLRQSGKTIKIEYLLNYLLTCGCANTTFRYGTKDNGLKKKVIETLKKELALLPKYIYSPIKGEDKDNMEVVTNAVRGNTINFSIGQAQEFKAQGEGRGYTTATQIFDEVAETTNSHIAIPASLAAGRAVRDEARAKGEYYGNVFACTAGSLDTLEGEFYYNLVGDGVWWSERFFDCENTEDLFATIAAGCRTPEAPIVNITMSHRQLGITDEQLERQIAESRGQMNPDQILRDYYSRWTRGGRTNPLTKEQLTIIHNSERDPVRVEITPDRYTLNWYCTQQEWLAFEKDTTIVAGLDVSNASGKDFCSLTFTDIRTLEVVMRCDIQQTNLLSYGLFLGGLMTTYQNVFLIPENKSQAQTLIDIVIVCLIEKGMDPFKRIYNTIFQEPIKHKRHYEEITRTSLSRRLYKEYYDEYKGYFGFITDKDNRRELYERTLQESIKMAGSSLKDRQLCGQIKVLEVKNNRVNHPAGGHDDAVISWLLTCWFAMYGQNFQQYNINPRLPLSLAVSTEDGFIDEQEREKQLYRQELNEEFKQLEEEYAKVEGIYALRIEQQMRQLNNEIARLGGVARNLDQLLADLTEKRRAQYRERQHTYY